jgi:serine/threonine-protein kinase
VVQVAGRRTLGRFEIERELGHGGMGVVYVAREKGLDRQVALKLLTPQLAAEPQFRERFEREARLVAALEHPNIVPIYAAGEIADELFIAMRLVPGEDLQQRLDREGALEPERAVALGAGVAGALDAAHGAGLVHRDVKPSNILLAGGGQDGVFLTDFGLVRERERKLTASGALLGTLDYMAPEQIDGADVDARADQYGLACLLFAALTGRPPFAGRSDAQTLVAHMSAPPPKASEQRPGLPPAVDAVLERGMAKQPQDRYPSCGALAAELGAALEGHAAAPTVPLARPTLPMPPQPRRRSRRVPVIAAGALAVVAAAGVALAETGSSGGKPQRSTSSLPTVTKPGTTAKAPAAHHGWSPSAAQVVALARSSRHPETLTYVSQTPAHARFTVWGVGDRLAVEVLPQGAGVRAMWAYFRKGELTQGGYQPAGGQWVMGSTPAQFPGYAYGRISALWTLANLAGSSTLRQLRLHPSAPSVRGAVACVHQAGAPLTQLCVRRDGVVTRVRHGADVIRLQRASQGYDPHAFLSPLQ